MAVTPSGKDKTLPNARMYVGGYDLSGDSRNLGSVELSFQEPDMTGWSETVFNYLAGQRMTAIRGYQCLMNDATAGAWTRLKTPGNTSIQLSFVLGGGGVPAVGDPAYHMAGVQISDPVGLESAAAILTADFLPDAQQVDSNTIKPWGVLLHPQATAISATLTASSSNSFDFGAASTAGWSATLQILSTSSGDYAFTIEHSADDSSFSTLGTFTADGSAIASEYLTGSGSVSRYVAFNAVKTAGTVTAVVTFARN